MAEETAAGPKSDAEPSVASPLSHREPPTIEGQAREIGRESEIGQESEPSAATDESTAIPPLAAQDEPSAGANALPAADAAIAAAPSPPPPPPPPPPPKRRANPLLFLLAMILGAAIALGGAYGLHLYERQNAAVTPNPDAKIAALGARLDAAERKIDAATTPLRESLAALDKRVAASEAAARAAQAKAEAAASDAQKALAAPPVPPPAAAENSTPGATAMAAEPVAAPTIDLGPLEAKLAELATRVAANEAALKAPKSENRADRETPPLPPPPALSPLANGSAIAIVAASLNGKVVRGAPFTQELTTLDALGADKAGLAPLRPLADKGVATEAQLAGAFQALADRLRATEAKDDASYLDRLAQHAANLVRVRRLDAGAGKDADSLVSRIESRLAQNDLPGALAAWNDLPPAAKNLSTAWADAVKTRLDALAAARGLEETAIVALGKAKS